MTISPRIAKTVLALSVLTAAAIYIIFVDTLSETDMVNLAYLWVPLAVSGAAVWWSGNTNIRFALTVLVAAFASLFVFFSIIFPML